MRSAIFVTNWVILGMLLFCFSYQVYYYFLLMFKRKHRHTGEEKIHRFAILIAARNEETVIGQLLESIRMQKYPAGMIDTYVVADNCEDDTAKVAIEGGAHVYERFNRIEIGKGYALNFLIKQMKSDGVLDRYDGYFVFDADNLLDRNYVCEMNRTFCDGYSIITSYRNAKNFDSNWITSGYGLWFLHESQWMNKARMLCHTSCSVSGTGFFFSREIMEEMGGWNHFLLTEDMEFSISQILRGETIGYCEKAVFYDEQPEDFMVSWNQRKRWIKGYQQVFAKYGRQIWKGMWKKRKFACFDMTMGTWPAFFILIFTIVASAVLMTVSFITGQDIAYTAYRIGMNFLVTYAGMLMLGGYTLFTEWKQIHAGIGCKIKSLFTFPIFMVTFAPIAASALMNKVEWKPIRHHCTTRISQVGIARQKGV